MTIYAVIIDDELDNAPFVKLIAHSSDISSLKTTINFNPYGAYSKIEKVKFVIKQLEALTLTTTFNGQRVEAHICAVDPF